MSKFNVGDRVRVTGDSAYAGHKFATGQEGVITVDHEGDWYLHDEYHVVALDEEAWWVDEADLELVTDSTDSTNSHAQAITAITTVTGLDLPDHVKTSVIKTLVDSL